MHYPCFRAIVLHETMNVTLKLPDELCKAARHRAVDESKSLSAWMADLVRRELEGGRARPGKPRTWMEAMSVDGAPDWFYEKEFPLEDRKAMKVREFDFEE